MIAGAVALGFFAVVVGLAAVVDGAVRRSKQQALAAEARRWGRTRATLTVRITADVTAFTRAMAAASGAAAGGATEEGTA